MKKFKSCKRHIKCYKGKQELEEFPRYLSREKVLFHYIILFSVAILPYCYIDPIQGYAPPDKMA